MDKKSEEVSEMKQSSVEFQNKQTSRRLERGVNRRFANSLFLDDNDKEELKEKRSRSIMSEQTFAVGQLVQLHLDKTHKRNVSYRGDLAIITRARNYPNTWLTVQLVHYARLQLKVRSTEIVAVDMQHLHTKGLKEGNNEQQSFNTTPLQWEEIQARLTRSTIHLLNLTYNSQRIFKW